MWRHSGHPGANDDRGSDRGCHAPCFPTREQQSATPPTSPRARADAATAQLTRHRHLLRQQPHLYRPRHPPALRPHRRRRRPRPRHHSHRPHLRLRSRRHHTRTATAITATRTGLTLEQRGKEGTEQGCACTGKAPAASQLRSGRHRPCARVGRTSAAMPAPPALTAAPRPPVRWNAARVLPSVPTPTPATAKLTAELTAEPSRAPELLTKAAALTAPLPSNVCLSKGYGATVSYFGFCPKKTKIDT